jgi:hypothetical protein
VAAPYRQAQGIVEADHRGGTEGGQGARISEFAFVAIAPTSHGAASSTGAREKITGGYKATADGPGDAGYRIGAYRISASVSMLAEIVPSPALNNPANVQRASMARAGGDGYRVYNRGYWGTGGGPQTCTSVTELTG